VWWARLVAFIGEKKNGPTLKSGNLKERNNMKNVNVHGRIILKRNLKKRWDGVNWINLFSPSVC
jgi:hypothetical protein